jgi:hypothetical protein
MRQDLKGSNSPKVLLTTLFSYLRFPPSHSWGQLLYYLCVGRIFQLFQPGDFDLTVRRALIVERRRAR